MFFAVKNREALYSQQETRLETDCGSDHICLNQIPYDYTVEVTNRFKGFDLIDRVPDELWREVHDIVHEAVIKTIPK